MCRALRKTLDLFFFKTGSISASPFPCLSIVNFGWLLKQPRVISVVFFFVFTSCRITLLQQIRLAHQRPHSPLKKNSIFLAEKEEVFRSEFFPSRGDTLCLGVRRISQGHCFRRRFEISSFCFRGPDRHFDCQKQLSRRQAQPFNRRGLHISRQSAKLRAHCHLYRTKSARCILSHLVAPCCSWLLVSNVPEASVRFEWLRSEQARRKSQFNFAKQDQAKQQWQ